MSPHLPISNLPTPMLFDTARSCWYRLLQWGGCTLVLLLLGAGGATAQLAEAPWPKLGGNLQNTGQSAFGGGGQSWQVTSVGTAQTGPSIAADGTIYVGGGSFGNTVLYAINPDSTQRWSFDPGSLIARSVQPIVGPDGAVYAGGEDGSGNGVLHALNTDGTSKWPQPFFAEAAPVQAAPAIASNGTIYVLVGSFSGGGEVHAVDPATGTTDWLVNIGYSTASPTIADDGTVYVGGNEGQIFAIDPNAQEATPLASLNGAVQGIAIGADGTLYATFGSNQVAALDPATGAQQWSATLGTENFPIFSVTVPVVGTEGGIFVGGAGEVSGAIYAFDGSGEERWSRHFADGLVDAAPAVASDGAVYVNVNRGIDSQLLAFAPSDGTQQWTFQPGARLDHAPVIAEDGTVYLASATGLFSVVGARIDLNPGQLATPRIGEPVDFSITMPQGFQPETRTFHYRPTGTATYQSIELTPTAGGTVLAGSIPESAVTLRGIDYYAEFSDGNLTVTFPQENPASDPAWLPTRFDQLAPPGTFEPNTYRMISIPAALSDSNLTSVFADYGSYDPERWRVVRWDSQSETYQDLPELGDVPATPGRAFWIITREGEPFTLGRGQATDGSGPHSIVLQSGWNQIGNPYAFPVSLASLDLPGSVTRIVQFDGQAFEDVSSVLAPWKGYFVYNSASNPVTLAIPPVEANLEASAEEAAVAETARNAADFTMRLTARLADGSLRDTRNVIGLADGAAAGRDPMDYVEAPPIGDHVRLSIVGDGERWAGSFKPPHGDGQWWDVEVTASVGEPLPTRKQVQVRLHEQGRRPEEFRRYVIDRDAGATLDAENGTFTVELSREQPVRHLRVILGTPTFAEAHAEDAALETFTNALQPNYPNPFGRSTTIQYQIRTSGHVVLQIYNMLGQHVRTLVDAKQKAGPHEVQWDGRNAQGTPVASGIYFCRLEAGSYEATRKLTLVR